MGLMSSSVLFAQTFQLPQPEYITDRQGLPQAFVAAIIQDEKGFIWIATLDGLCRYDGDRFRVFQPSPGDSAGLSGPGVIGIQTDHNGKLWIETQEELELFDPQSEKFFNLSQQPFYKEHFKRLPTVSYPDSRQRLWLSNQEGLSVVDLATRHIQVYRHQPDDPHSLSHDVVTAILEDRHGTIWVATAGGGLDCLDEKTGRFRHYRIRPDNTNALADDKTMDLYERPDGRLMILSHKHLSLLEPVTGQIKSYPIPQPAELLERVRFATDSKGNDYFSQFGNLYRFNDRDGITCVLQKSSDATRILGLFIDRSDVLWVGTSGSGVYKFNLKASAFQSRPYTRNFYTDLLKDGIGLPEGRLPVFSPGASSYYFRYTLDSSSKFWFNVGSTPFYYADLVTREVTKVPLPVSFDNIYPLPPAPLATDPDGRVWFLYDSLAMWYDEPRKRWEQFPHLVQLFNSREEPVHAWNQTHLLQFVVDRAALWVATDKRGLYRVDRQTGRTQHYTHSAGDSTSLSSNLLFCLFEDPDEPDILWVGTFGAGLCRFNKKTGKSMVFDTKDGLPNNVIYAAIPDNKGWIWIATNRGLCRMNRKTFEKKTFTREDGLLADEFNRFHFVRLPDDQIILGGLEGITSFYPDEILDDSYQPEVEITGIRVRNVALEPGPSSLIDSLSLRQVSELRLNYSQNSLAVEFAGLQYNSFKSIDYRYQLEGLDNEWIRVNRGEAIYTNLTPGSYTLKLNTTNTAGLWSPHVRTLSIHIAPPWWATWWAYLVYGIAAVYVGYVLIRLYIKERETQQLRVVDELKTRFFSNITHDFRTPLTLILGPAQQLRTTIDDQEKIPFNRTQIDTIERNANQLLQLVNQLLDLSKLEANALQMEIIRGNLMSFIKQLLSSFQSQADEKQIRLVYQYSEVSEEYAFDAGKLERILYNLVANALKFTGEGGEVGIEVTGTEDGIALTVSDTGNGIPAKKLPHIFDRFYQVDSASNFQQQGTGIGLSLVKELVELQGGRIEVTSQVGQGTVFGIFLPYVPVVTGKAPPEEVSRKPAALPNTGRIDTDADAPGILIVEDNPELAAYIANSLPPTYRITLARNGKEGWDAALATCPDLIISDVMMPVMDGFTLCKHVKEDIRTSHIPVLLLTAKVSHESRIAGLSHGADDYIAKPFHMDELQLRVQNVLEHQKKYRDWMQSQLTDSDMDVRLDPGEKINPFLKKMFDFLEEHLDNTLFGVDDIIAEFGMSRMTLFRKVKALTGLATSDLIRNYRLNRAAEFLKEGVTVSETAYKVGFNSLAYFSKCFRALYHMTPSEFIRKHR